MGSADITKATIWEDGDVTEMARFQVDGVNGLQADVATIVRKIFDMSDGKTLLTTDSMVVADTVFNVLQTDARWTKDSTGYNFKDRIPGAKFPTGGRTYRVEYYFVGTAAEQYWIVFEHYAQAVGSS